MSHVLDGPDAPSGAAPLPDGSAVETPPAAGPAPPRPHVRSGYKTPPSPESSGEGGADSGPGRQQRLRAATRVTPPASDIPVMPLTTAVSEPVFARRDTAFRPAESGVS